MSGPRSLVYASQSDRFQNREVGESAAHSNMPGAAIVIEITATDASSPYTAALLEACTRGSRANVPCLLPSEGDATPPAMVAVVTWEGTERRAVQVQVGAHRTAGPEWSNRHLTFNESDAEVERWRAVGLVIATLAGEVFEAEPARALPPEPAPKKQPEPARPSPPAAAPDTRSPAWTLQAGAELARGSGNSLSAYGASLRITRQLLPRFLFATASARYELEPTTSTGVQLSWAWATLGLGASVPLVGTNLSFEGRVEPALGSARAALAHPAPGTGAQSGTLFALREGAGLVWWWSEWLGVDVSADAFEISRRTVVRDQNGSRDVARVEPFGWSTAIGLRVGFGR